MITKAKNKSEPTVEPFYEYLAEYFASDAARSKVAIAAESNISRMYLDDLIKGNKTNVSLEIAVALSKAMGTTLSKILEDAVIHS